MSEALTFGAASRPYIEQARIPAADILPLIPHDARLNVSSKADPTQRGKIPGVLKRDGSWVGMTGTWASEGLTAAQRNSALTWPTPNVGLRTAGFPAIDLDVRSERARDLIEAAAVETFGRSPIREREGSPRALMLFRHAGPDIIHKRVLKFDLDGQTHAVDFLGHGQQCVVAGIHPSGQPYRWREGHDLCAWGVDGLAPVTAARMAAFYDHVIEVVRAAGGTIGVTTRIRHGANADGGHGVCVADLEPYCDPELTLRALHGVPNTAENLPTRDDLVKMLSSVRAALGRRAEEFRGEASAWATAESWCPDDAYFSKIWESIEFSQVGPDYLFQRARKAGWHGTASMDFDAVVGGEVEAQINAAQEEQEERRETLETASKQLAYWPKEQTWIVTSTGEMLSHGALNHHAIGMSVAPAGKTGVLSAAAKLRNSGLIRDIVGVTYAPGKPSLTEWTWQGMRGVWFNRWRAPVVNLPAPRSIREEDVRPWLDHLAWLFPDDGERKTLMQWMAYLVKNPGIKVRFAPVILGKQGVGKDMALKPLVHALGEHNTTEIGPHVLMGNWTWYYEKQLIIVQEMARQTKMEVYERIKADITGTGADTLMVENKFEPAYPIPNTAAYAFLTNHEDAFAISADDRRFFVIRAVPLAPREPAYYDAIVAWYDKGGLARVARYLHDFDLTGFRADSAPAWTDAKREMMDATQPRFATWLREELDDGRFANRTVMTMQEIGHLARDLSIPPEVREKIGTKVAVIGFTNAGWLPRASAVRFRTGKQQRVWVKTSDLLTQTPAVLEARLLSETGAAKDFTVVPEAA